MPACTPSGRSVTSRKTAAWQGYRGSNDESAALTGGYHRITAPIAGYERGVAGDAFTLLAAWTPSERLALSASWGLTDAGIEQDLLLGGPGNPGSAFPSPDTDWSGRTRIADLRASWTATRRLAFTAGGLWIDGRESYDPTFAQGAGLEEAGEVDFTKLMGTLQAKLRLPSGVGLTLGGFWARYDDGAGAQEGDGTVRGLLAAVDLRW